MRVGSGDVSLRDLDAVRGDLWAVGRQRAVFVCVARPREIEEVLGKNRFGTKRLTWSERLRSPIRPTVSSVARGARLALLPGRGLVWVDGEHLFKQGETVPLAWMEPPVELEVVRPGVVKKALRAALGPSGPQRAEVAAD